jgi:hypothetical protein
VLDVLDNAELFEGGVAAGVEVAPQATAIGVR